MSAPAARRSLPPAAVAERGDAIRALERDWKQLYRRAPANPFLSWEWQQAWLAAHPACMPRVVLFSFEDGKPAGLLALARRRRHGLRQLEFLAQGSGADDLDCLLDPDAPPNTAGRLLAAALDRDGWDVLRLEGARPASAVAAALKHAPGLARVREEPGEWLPYLPLPSSFDQYLANQSANFRAQIRRRRRALAALERGAWVEIAQTPQSVGAALESLFRLHNLRRWQCGQSGSFETRASRAFLTRAGAALAGAGASRVYLLRTASNVIAALYGLEAGSRFYYYQSGFDPAWMEWSPGTVLLSYVIEDCIGRGLQHFEFLRGDEGYKARWTGERRRGVVLHAARGALGRGYLGLRAWRRRWMDNGKEMAA